MKLKKAIALRYETGYRAPMVTAVGFGEIAGRIIQEAEKSNVPIMENEALAEELAHISANQVIPPELYETCATILAYVFSIENSLTSDK